MMDSAVAWFYEHARAENERSPKWIARWEAAMKRSFEVLESGKEKLPVDFHIGAVALSVAMTYIVLRYKIDLKKEYPKCAAWLAEFEKRPAMRETVPPPPQ
jgi:glutathione S-transferase